MVLFKVVAYSICLLNEYSWLNTSQFIHLFSKKVNQIKKKYNQGYGGANI